MRTKNITEIVQRILEATGERSRAALGRRYQISPQAISSWESREIYPYALIVQIAEELGVSLEWLIWGEDPMLRSDQSVSSTDCTLTPSEDQLLTVFRHLADQDQQAVQRLAEEKKCTAEDKKRITDLEARLKELEAAVVRQENVK